MFDNAQYRKLLLVNWVSEIFINTKRVTKRGLTLCLTVSMEIYFMILLHDMQNKFFKPKTFNIQPHDINCIIYCIIIFLLNS